MEFTRLFTTEDWTVDTVDWERRDAIIYGKEGVVFEQKNVEVPKFWSDTSLGIVASKYFKIGESSVKDIIHRVVTTIVEWGLKEKYFDSDNARIFTDELSYILIYQYASPNSPVWFNLGVPGRSQVGSACFLLDVEDNMDSIRRWYALESKIFQAGSGAGVNVSKLRKENAPLSQGGSSSGPISFMKGADAQAGIIRSGGKTRRAAKAVLMDHDHPDLSKFIDCKWKEEEKAGVLVTAGYSDGMNGEAIASVAHQNANYSVRVTDQFMELACKEDTPESRILDQIAEAAWKCGDPGLLYSDTITESYMIPTCGMPLTCNPCFEIVSQPVFTACNLASINVLKFSDERNQFNYQEYKHVINIQTVMLDIICYCSDYPDEEIAKNTREQHHIGLGYTNIGSLLMVSGLPYDSISGRKFVETLSFYLTGQALLTSTYMAEELGPFVGYEDNKDKILDVLHKFIDQDTQNPTLWTEVIKRTKKYGLRNANVTAIAPTGCLTPESLINTNKGLLDLSSIGDITGREWQDIDLEVETDCNIQKSTKFYINKLENVVSIKTDYGYELTGVPSHSIKVYNSGELVWRRLADLTSGDILPLSLNEDHKYTDNEVLLKEWPKPYRVISDRTHSPKYMTKELAELLGLFMRGGSLHIKGIRISIPDYDTETICRIQYLAKSLFNIDSTLSNDKRSNCLAVCLNSTTLVKWWILNNFNKLGLKGKHKVPFIPNQILKTNNKNIYCAFLRGIYEADGTVTAGVPSISTHYLPFKKSIKALLLFLGYPTSDKIDKNGYGNGDQYCIRLQSSYFLDKWMTDIGFISTRKIELVNNSSDFSRYDFIPLTQNLYDKIKKQLDCRSLLYRSFIVGYQRNGYISRNLANKIIVETEDSELKFLVKFFFDTLKSKKLGELETTCDLSVPSNNTYIANGFISHNTISFMMDASTTGIEPELALIKYKSLVGGGSLKLVNPVVERALKYLGYQSELIDRIKEYISMHNTVVGSCIEKEHEPIFATSFGDNTLDPMAHVKMVAAAQKFITEGISKTCNLPESATPQDIRNIYIEAWRLKLKAVAVYRDNSKNNQPLNLAESKKIESKSMRNPLSDERKSITHKFEIAGFEGYVHVGLYENGEPGELFIDASKCGSTVAGLLDSFAIAISIGLQYGVPLGPLVEKFMNSRFEPSGFTKNPEIRIATSIVDYLFRWLKLKFIDKKNTIEPVKEIKQLSGEFCKCGGMLIKTGVCSTCTNCGTPSGGCG
jgi:ribonucleoside-diphosphate reductase alpha chain